LDEAKKRLSSPMNGHKGKPTAVFVVVYFKALGYTDQDVSQSEILGTYSNFESANVRAMENFQKMGPIT